MNLRSILRYAGLVVTLFILMLTVVRPSLVAAYSQADLNSIIGQTPFYDPQATSCSTDPISASAPGTGTATGMVYPNLDAGKMANAIEQFITKHNPDSKLKGTGSTIVASAKSANINPFLVPAHALIESGLAKADDPNVQNANNSFGRTATPSQPYWQGARLWYKWSSVKASVDHSAPENVAGSSTPGGDDYPSYLRTVYGPFFDKNDFDGYINKYAPPTENDSAKYVANFKANLGEMAGYADGTTASPSTSLGTPVPSTSCCTTASTAFTALSGDNPEIKFMNYVMKNGNLNLMQAAGIAGNIQSESIFDPKADNGSHRGIAQWTNPGRFTKLTQFAADKQGNADDLDTQIHYLGWELGIDGVWKGNAGGDYKIALTNVQAANDVASAAKAWDEYYEISGEHGGGTRGKNAQALYDKYKDGPPTTSGTATAPAVTDNTCASAGTTTGAGDWVFYTQWDPSKPWANKSYYGGTMATSGCEPTADAMIVATLKDKTITPDKVADYIAGLGQEGQASVQPKVAEHYGLKSRKLAGMDEALVSLKAGNVVVESARPNPPFTSEGHFVVLRALTPSGKILIGDPNSGAPGSGLNRESYQTKEWDPAYLAANSNVEYYEWSK